MGQFAIGTIMKIAGWVAVSIIVGLNLQLVIETASNMSAYKLFAFAVIAAFGVLMVYIVLHPYITKNKSATATSLHTKSVISIPAIKRLSYNSIAVCVDFSVTDQKAISEGFSLGNKDTKYYLIHIVESAAARATGMESRDFETLDDWNKINEYCLLLKEEGYETEPLIGFGSPKKDNTEIGDKVRG
jgi:manganese transport protein